MSALTRFFKMQKLEQGDNPWTNDSRFFQFNLDLIDLVLRRFLTHTHDGSDFTHETPDSAPELALDDSGLIPAGLTAYYRYTLIDADGIESAASPVSSLSLPDPISTPGGVSADYETTGGALMAGDYAYVVSAYTDVSTEETVPSKPTLLRVTSSPPTTTNVITLQLPTVPSGATGFNLYRRTPGSGTYLHLATIDMSVLTPPTEYVDDGTVIADPVRTYRNNDTTNSHNSIIVGIPGATPVVPAGYTWRIYRTFDLTNWESSLLYHVVEETVLGSGDIVTEYTDIGEPTEVGSPPDEELAALSNPPPIDLGTQSVGNLGPGRITAHVHTVRWAFPGPLEAQDGEIAFLVEDPNIQIIGCRPLLGLDSAAAAQDVIVDILKDPGGGGSPSTIYTTSANRPYIDVGEQIGVRTVPDDVDGVVGDVYYCNVVQDGGGATTTDQNLVVNMYYIAYGYPEAPFTPGDDTSDY